MTAISIRLRLHVPFDGRGHADFPLAANYFDGNGDQALAPGTQVRDEFVGIGLADLSARHDLAVAGLFESRLDFANHGEYAATQLGKLPPQAFAAGYLGEGEQDPGVDGAQMIMEGRRVVELQEKSGIAVGSGDAQELVERDLQNIHGRFPGIVTATMTAP